MVGELAVTNLRSDQIDMHLMINLLHFQPFLLSFDEVLEGAVWLVQSAVFFLQLACLRNFV